MWTRLLLAVTSLACVAPVVRFAPGIPRAAAEIATLRLVVRDRGSRMIVPARVYLTDTTGRWWAPQGSSQIIAFS